MTSKIPNSSRGGRRQGNRQPIGCPGPKGWGWLHSPAPPFIRSASTQSFWNRPPSFPLPIQTSNVQSRFKKFSSMVTKLVWSGRFSCNRLLLLSFLAKDLPTLGEPARKSAFICRLGRGLKLYLDWTFEVADGALEAFPFQG